MNHDDDVKKVDLCDVCGDDEKIEIILETARQQVKKIVKQEREGEKINCDLLNFRMRHMLADMEEQIKRLEEAKKVSAKTMQIVTEI